METINSDKIRRFYLCGFEEKMIHRAWPRLWSKQFKIRTQDGSFLKLNRFRDRHNFGSLKRSCVHFAPQNVYMSVLNWLMPDRVGRKVEAPRAYPVGGEYVIDIDLYLVWRPHRHLVGEDGVCVGCLRVSKDATVRLCEKICENYSDIHVVFSGKQGFHIHVWDFEVRDWTYYDAKNPIKSHEVARFLYTRHIKAATGGFDNSHFRLSCDPMRVVSFPESLNGETGLICKYLGNPKEFENTSIPDILWRSKASKYFYNTSWESLNHTHPEPFGAMTVCAKTGGGEHG